MEQNPQMSHHSRNWLKFGVLVALAFVLGLFFAGLLDLPRASLAQGPGQGGHTTPIVTVDAPRIPAARPLAELSEAFSAVAEAVRPSVVYIESDRPVSSVAQNHPQLPPGLEPFFQQPNTPQRGIEQSSGSGFIVSSDGYILTNNHVIEGASDVTVRLLDGRSFPATIVGSDKDTDVGVLKIDAKGLTPAALGSSADSRVGEWVLAIGNPLGEELTFSVTQGIISAKGRGQLQLGDNNQRTQIQDFIQTDAAINRGNSGGPLVNVKGEVIGINSAIASYTGFYAGYAFAVPIDLARAVMNQIIATGKVQRTQMGIFVRTATAEDAEYLGLSSIAGVKIDNFPPNAPSPAEKAGLKQGDVIVAIDGKPVKYVAQLQQLVGFRTPGEQVHVTVARPGGTKEFTVRLAGGNGETESADTAAPAPAEPDEAPAATQNRLGIAVEPLTPSLAEEVQVSGTVHGLLVREVAEHSPATDHLCPANSCRNPDVIVAIEGKPVKTVADFKSALANGGRNGIVTLTVIGGSNDGQSRIERVRLEDKK